MKCEEILNRLEKDMPLSYALDWDNVGLLLGRYEKEVKKVLVVLDVTLDVVTYALDSGVDLILSHHPLLFKAVKSVTDKTVQGRKLLSLMRADIAVISMHTNYDIAPACMGDICARILGLKNTSPLDITNTIEEKDIGVGAIGTLDRRYSIEEIITLVKERFVLSSVSVFGKDLHRDGIKKVAISPGSGKGMYPYAKAMGVQVLITGDITHHEGIDAKDDGICIIDAGHFGLEKVFLADMKKRLDTWGEDIEVVDMLEQAPFTHE